MHCGSSLVRRTVSDPNAPVISAILLLVYHIVKHL